MKYEAIYAIQTGSREFSVRKMCEAMGLRAENYYRWKRRRIQREEREEKERETVAVIRKVFLENKRLYGYRKIRKSLEKQGILLSEYKIRLLMRKNGLYPVSIRRYRPGRSLSVRVPHSPDALITIPARRVFLQQQRKNTLTQNYVTMNIVKEDIFENVELLYNRKRKHSYLGYMSPKMQKVI